MATIVSSPICWYLVQFRPKYRRNVLLQSIVERIKTILAEQIECWGQELLGLEVMPDHVHMLVECDPRRYTPLGEAAQRPQLNSYFCSTVGAVTLETLNRYAENQKGK
jgi:putative transposase